MLPTQINSVPQTDILPTQNIGLVDQNQPQIYSLLANSNNPSSTKQSRRKKPTKVDETIPVMLNPQITRTPTGVSFDMSHHRTTILPDSIPSFVPTHLLNGHPLPLRYYIEPNSYDANNNINHNQIPSPSLSLNSTLPLQAQQVPLWSNDSLPVMNGNSMTQMVAKPQLFDVSRFLTNNINHRAMSTSPTQQNEFKHRHPTFAFNEHGSLLGLPHPLPSQLISTPASMTPSTKPKRKQQPSVQQISQCPTTFTPPIVMTSLPSTIPASVTAMPMKSGEHSFPMDVSAISNFNPLTPPASTSSTKSSPTNTNNESSLISKQQHLLPQTAANITEMHSISKPYFPDQEFFHTQNTTNDSPTNHLPYNIHRLLAAAYPHCYMFPTSLTSANRLPMGYPSMLPGTIITTASGSIPSDIKKARKKREKPIRKSKIEQIQKDEPTLIPKSLTTDISAGKKPRRKNIKPKDIRTKKQLRRITRRNQLAVLKYMIRKRKQQKQERIAIPKLPDIKTGQIAPKLVSIPMTKPDNMETNLPDILTPGLKISFDSTRKIESISLYYHRRRKPDIINENSLKLSINADNKLGLLLEALELIETLHSSSKLVLPSVK